MKTKILKISIKDRERAGRAIEQAAAALAAGGVIAYPTETTYGLGADATNDAAVKKIFELKGRDDGKPMPVVVSDLRMAMEYAKIDAVAEHLANAFMPGPLTLIVDKKQGISDVVSKDGIGFRIPSHFIARGVAGQLGKPVIATSANKSGQPGISKEVDLIEQFNGKVDVIISSGDLFESLASTILDIRVYPPKIVRQGPTPYSEIMAELSKYAPSTQTE